MSAGARNFFFGADQWDYNTPPEHGNTSTGVVR